MLRNGIQWQMLAVVDLTQGITPFIDMVTVSPCQRAHVVYSDPPWSPGNEKWWRRYAGSPPPKSYTDFLDAWCASVVACDPDHIFCEQSSNKRHRQFMIDATVRCKGWRWPLLEQWMVRYGSPKRPNVLLHFGNEKLTVDPSGMGGEAMTTLVIESLGLPSGSVVADPCIGLGMTSRVAHKLGHNCIGTELNAARLGTTIKWAERNGYHNDEADRPTKKLDPITQAIADARNLDEHGRVAFYNRATSALGQLVVDISDDPACSPQLVRADAIESNDYNPNKVASPELDLLEQSMRADGITMPIVVMHDAARERWTVIDGFHRHTVASARLGRKYLPCSVIDRGLADRMASTVRHNRARGKHQVELMASLVKGMMDLGWDDARIAEALGMSEEELLRLRQMVGAARLLAAEQYSRSWGKIEESDDECPEDGAA